MGKNVLLPNVKEIVILLEAFLLKNANFLPSTAANSLSNYLKENANNFKMIPKTLDHTPEIQYRFVSLRAIFTEMDYLLSDTKTYILRLTERAFRHLQRLIVVDEDIRTKWNRAFGHGERECEKLGAVHLLWHGIWAFNAKAKGEATDLVMGEPIDSARLDEIGGSAEALVLTEWKLARRTEEIESQIAQGKTQARLYSRGCLGGIELEDYRYIVIVTEKYFALPPVAVDEGIEFKVINIAVDPDVPSKVGETSVP